MFGNLLHEELFKQAVLSPHSLQLLILHPVNVLFANKSVSSYAFQSLSQRQWNLSFVLESVTSIHQYVQPSSALWLTIDIFTLSDKLGNQHYHSTMTYGLYHACSTISIRGTILTKR